MVDNFLSLGKERKLLTTLQICEIVCCLLHVSFMYVFHCVSLSKCLAVIREGKKIRDFIGDPVGSVKLSTEMPATDFHSVIFG